MSPPADTAPGGPPEDQDILAAEWVLGVLDGEERADAIRRLGTDAGFAASVVAWEARLAPLAFLTQPVEPPALLWSRIAARLPAVPLTADPGNRLPASRTARPVRDPARRWKFATAASLALAACLAGLIVLRVPLGQLSLGPVAPARVAVLAPPGGPPVFVVEAAGATLRVRPVGGIQVADGRDLELWSLREGATRPESLGVLPAAGRVVPATLPAGTQVLVSLEPRGGSPTGQPTGSVVYAGRLASLE